MNLARIFIAVLSLMLVSASFAADFELTGKVIQGGLMVGKTLPGSHVKHDGKNIRVAPNGVFVIGFNRDAKPKSHLTITLPDGSKLEKDLAVEQRKYNIQRIDGLPPSKVTPKKPEVLERIRKETALVKAVRKRDDERLDFLPGFDWPVVGPITGVYGSQRILNGKPRRPHYGVDIAAPVGTPVKAPADGLVTLSYPDMFYSGGTMIIDHGHGVSSAFLHLSKVIAKEGQFVRRGEVVAEVGAKGRSSGPHLDWRINLFEKRLDPRVFAKPMPK